MLRRPVLTAQLLLPSVHQHTPSRLGALLSSLRVRGGPGRGPFCPSGQALTPAGGAADKLEGPSRTDHSQGREREGFARQLRQQVPWLWMKGKGYSPLLGLREVHCGFFLHPPFFPRGCVCTPSFLEKETQCGSPEGHSQRVTHSAGPADGESPSLHPCHPRPSCQDQPGGSGLPGICAPRRPK